jgi:hypothetical protein
MGKEYRSDTLRARSVELDNQRTLAIQAGNVTEAELRMVDSVTDAQCPVRFRVVSMKLRDQGAVVEYGILCRAHLCRHPVGFDQVSVRVASLSETYLFLNRSGHTCVKRYHIAVLVRLPDRAVIPLQGRLPYRDLTRHGLHRNAVRSLGTTPFPCASTDTEFKPWLRAG